MFSHKLFLFSKQNLYTMSTTPMSRSKDWFVSIIFSVAKNPSIQGLG